MEEPEASKYDGVTEPVLVFSGTLGEFLADDGGVLSKSVAYKVECYIEGTLVDLEAHGSTVATEWWELRVRPLPGCRVTHRVVVRRDYEVNRLAVACTCQAARGTTAQHPRRCSHGLAAQRFIESSRGKKA